jgi:hypothetical protein
MNRERIMHSLAIHAGFRNEEEDRSFGHALWLRGKGAVHSDLATLSDDLLAIFSELNVHWNTSSPEAIEGKRSVLEREFVAPIVTLLSGGLDYLRSHPTDVEAARAISRISIAWQAVIDGDIADLKQHVEDTEVASDL